MKNTIQTSFIYLLFILCILAPPADAELWVDYNRGLVYDTDRDVTWLRDANLAGVKLSQDDAVNWADNLVYEGYDDWRIPSALNLDGSYPCTDPTCDDTQDNHFRHLWATELGNQTTLSYNVGPFVNVKIYSQQLGNWYWSSTKATHTTLGRGFAFYTDIGDNAGKITAWGQALEYYAWPLRDGNSGITGTVVPDLTILPGDTVKFYNTIVGVESVQTLTLYNVMNVHFNANLDFAPEAPFSIASEGSDCFSGTVDPGHSCTIPIKFVSDEPGIWNSSIQISSKIITLIGSATPAGNSLPSAPDLVQPEDGAVGASATELTFVWNESEDNDEDPISYSLYYSTNSAFSETDPITIIALRNRHTYFAVLFSGAGMLFYLMLMAFSNNGSMRMMLSLFLVSSIAFLITCGGGGNGGVGNADSTLTYTVSGLDAETTYYWKVVCSDDKGGMAESGTYRFTTAR